MSKLREFTPVFTEELPYKKDMEFGKIYKSFPLTLAAISNPQAVKLN